MVSRTLVVCARDDGLPRRIQEALPLVRILFRPAVGVPLVVDPRPAQIREIAQILPRPSQRLLPLTRARLAWADRSRVLSSDNRTAARGFLDLAQRHDHEAYAVPEAATALDLSVRHLDRLVSAEFGYPPAVLLGLARIVSVAQDIAGSEDLLNAIARAHAYQDPAAMNRRFWRFAGLSPGAYRTHARFLRQAGTTQSWPKMPIEFQRRST